MTSRFHRFAPAVLAGTAALSIIAAPAAAAADTHLACVYQSEGNSQCETPGNVQLTATPQDVPYPQQYPFLFGGQVLSYHHGMGGGHR